MLPVQSFPWELVLFAVFVVALLFVVRRVRQRRMALPAAASVDLPHLTTNQRLTATIRRVFRDNAQGVWLVIAEAGGTKLTFCAVDYEQSVARYNESIGKPVTVALFALATLAAGGIEAMREQIADADRVDLRPDMVRLIPQGQYANDYVVIGRALDAREDSWDEMPLTVYRTQVLQSEGLSLTLDLAAPRVDAAFSPASMVHGSARLFGCLAD